MRFKKRLGAMLTKLALLVILLIMLQGAASAPMSKITNCQFEQRYFHVCSTGTGLHAVTKGDVIRFLNSQPDIGHNSSLVHVLAITDFKYTTLGDTDYFHGMSGSDLPSKSTPVVLVQLRGIVANSDARPVTGLHQFYEDASLVIIINAQTGDIFSWLVEPV
ncbi:MAG: hypothetical protein H0W02_20880 [Ktedonobacteraceae bacterium]|nr:hypothetical protein [Ktedonobacteraceae bacterium]